jgi:hypothetical protein
MNYNEFTLKCIELAPYELQEMLLVDQGCYGEKWCTKSRWHRYNKKDIKDEKFVLRVEWSTGGVSGGSCWDSSDPHPYTSNEPPAELTELDAILENFHPNVSFIQYKNLLNTLVEHGTRHENEYYGNSTDYRWKKIELEKLYDYMKEKGWLE